MHATGNLIMNSTILAVSLKHNIIFANFLEILLGNNISDFL